MAIEGTSGRIDTRAFNYLLACAKKHLLVEVIKRRYELEALIKPKGRQTEEGGSEKQSRPPLRIAIEFAY
jgi:hypothetical protein